MKIQKKPDYLIFADDAKTGELESFPNILRGWGITIDQTQSKPPMEWMNGVFHRIDENTLYLLQQGVPEWDNNVLYPVDAVIKYKSKLYIATVQNDNTIPSTNTTKWSKVVPDTIDASTTQRGVVKLNSAVNSTSTTEAATPSAVKTTYDLANKALKAGDYGLGSSSTFGLIIGDISQYFATGFYIIGNTTTGNVPHAASNLIIHRQNAELQTGISISSDSNEVPKYGIFTKGSWKWQEFMSTSLKVLPDFKSLSNKSGMYIAYGSKFPSLATPNAPAGSNNSKLSVTVRCDGSIAHYEVIENVAGNPRKWIGECYLNSGNPVLNWTEVITTANINSNVQSYPIGIPQPWPTLIPPTGWLKCNGAIFDKTKYPKLALAYPSGKLPDLRGEFIRGLDDGRGIDSGRSILSLQNQQVVAHKHLTLACGEQHAGNFANSWGLGTTNTKKLGISSAAYSSKGHFYTNDGSEELETSNIPLNQVGLVGAENRPRNIAFLYIVKAE